MYVHVKIAEDPWVSQVCSENLKKKWFNFVTLKSKQKYIAEF